MNKIPLAQRLGQDAGTVAPVKLGFVQLRDFFSALEDLNADGYYSDVYATLCLTTHPRPGRFQTVSGLPRLLR